ncbi:MAG: substrate-binding domain-containing protein [Lentisphaeria bacterium]|nr:substrate-binding domain-containing protein [Lentisphaeria bacterium]
MVRNQEQSEELFRRLCVEVRRFTPGARFHTVRQIIDDFDASRRVVDAALDRMERKGIVERRSRSGIFVRAAGACRKIIHLYPDWPSEDCKGRAERFRSVFGKLDGCEFAGLPFNYRHELLPIMKGCDADAILVDWPARPIRPDEIAELAMFRCLVVVMGRDLRDASLNCVFSDSGYSALQAINCFVRHGHRKLALLQAEPAVGGNLYFQQSILLYAKLCGCEILNIDCHAVDGDYSPEQAYSVLSGYLDRNGCPFTGLAVNSGLAAKGALLALAEHGIRVPGEVSLIGMGSGEAARLFNPPVTVVQGLHEEQKIAAAVDRHLRDPDSGLIAIATRSMLELRKSVRNINREEP